MRILILILFFFASTGTSCKKYEEGSRISLRSKKARLVGEWELIDFNGKVIIIDSLNKVSTYSWSCNKYYEPYERIIIKKQIFWEFERDYDVKEKYFGLVKNLNYGLSYNQPDCFPLYNEDSLQTVVIKKWEFSNKKEQVAIIEGNSTRDFDIIKLTNSDLKLENDFGDVYTFKKVE